MKGETRGPALALTGGTGLVGRAVLRAAAAEDVSVRALYRTQPGDAAAAWLRGDLDDDAALDALCAGVGVVLHVAGATASIGEGRFHAVNVVGAARVAAAARRAGAGHFILVSSQAARAPGLSAYARSKRLGEAAVRRAAGDMRVSVVRPPALFGEGDPATAPLFAAIRRGVLPVPGGRGWRERRFAAVTSDVLGAYLLRVATGEVGGTTGSAGEPSAYPTLGWDDLAASAREAGHPVRLLPIPPVLLRALGAASDLVARVTRRPAVFGLGKVNEMLHSDWRASGPVIGQLSLAAALRPLLGAPRASANTDRRARAGQGHPLTRHS